MAHDDLAELLALAVEMKKVAVRADRPAIAAKADEVIALVRDASDPVDRGDGKTSGEAKTSRDEKANAVIRLLDGLGL